ncbi:MAG TPA: IS1380 family transposase [Candidatus Sulfobium mesophilum]|nr:IS1380 family transposase [Candidatus Sulfobium mesophilum]
MAQKALPYEYEIEGSKAGLTSFGGLPTYLDLASATGFLRSIDRHLRIRSGQGWTDRQMILSLVLLNLVGGDCVEDIDKLEADEGFGRIMRKVEMHGLTRKGKRTLKNRWRKERTRTFPSASAIFRYLANFHNVEEEKCREKGKAYIPAPNKYLKAFGKINAEMISVGDKQETATLDMDATIAATLKDNALYSYKGGKAYQPLNTYWHERGLILHTEFRDGNVPAGHEQLRVLQEALGYLPLWVKKVRLRSDTAGYQHDIMRYCDLKDNKRFGRIEFAIGADVTSEFRKAVSEVREKDWQPLYREVNGQMKETGRQWAEVCFVPNKIGHSKNGPVYRYLATREELKQAELPGMEKGDEEYLFPVMRLRGQQYKIFGIVTNMDWAGQELIGWLYERCGKSEEAHAAMKNDFAGGRFPSGDFGENAAWWWVMILAYNLNSLMKRLVLGESWVNKRMKAIRFGLIIIAARIIDRSRRLWVRISGSRPSSELLIDMRRKVAQLATTG